MIVNGDEKRNFGGEGQRFYSQDGTVVNLVPYKDKKRQGEFRKPTLRDCKELGLAPSVTTIGDIFKCHGLETWKDDQIYQAAYACPPIAGETFAEWKSHIAEKATEKSRNAREKGKLIHKVIEQRIKDGIVPADDSLKPFAQVAEQAALKLGFPMGVHCEKTFYHPMRFGGCVDYHYHTWRKYGDIDKPPIILDWKSYEGEKTASQLAYTERGVQLRAYQEGLGYIHARLINAFVSVDRPGEWSYYEWPEESHERLWGIFKAAHSAYMLMNNL